MTTIEKALLIWLAAVSLTAAALTIYDKLAAKRRPRGRIRERTLLICGALGGATAMLAVMLLIRHKTRHMKFMLGLPAMILLHIAVYLLFG